MPRSVSASCAKLTSPSLLEHPNIVSIHNRGEADNGQLWIAMQYVAGTDAEAALQAGTMTAAQAIRIAGEVAKAWTTHISATSCITTSSQETCCWLTGLTTTSTFYSAIFVWRGRQAAQMNPRPQRGHHPRRDTGLCRT